MSADRAGADPDAAASTDEQLSAHRRQIDHIDQQILALMNQRIGQAQAIGRIKAGLHAPAFYRPEREAQILSRLHAANAGPMKADDVEALFREIMSLTRNSEAQLSVSLLGPSGTYSEDAARRHFGSTVRVDMAATVAEAFKMAEGGQSDCCVVPAENSTEGGVGVTLDCLVTTALTICGEIHFKIRHSLLSRATDLDAIEAVMAHPQALAQCRHWLNDHLAGKERIPTGSNAEAVRQIADHPNRAAIAGATAAEHYNLNVVAANIEDEADNTTRFLVLSARATPASGDDKTSLLLSARNRPGALLRLLQPLLEGQIDMTRLESRPSRTGLWEYVFFIDLLGHHQQPAIAAALERLKSEAGLFKLLGSYPRSV